MQYAAPTAQEVNEENKDSQTQTTKRANQAMLVMSFTHE